MKNQPETQDIKKLYKIVVQPCQKQQRTTQKLTLEQQNIRGNSTPEEKNLLIKTDKIEVAELNKTTSKKQREDIRK